MHLIPVSFSGTLDSGFQSLEGFRIRKPTILDFTRKISPGSRFHKQKINFTDTGIRILLHGTINNHWSIHLFQSNQ